MEQNETDDRGLRVQSIVLPRCTRCDGSGWMWPNLGVNCPAGAAWSIATNQAMMRQMSGASYYIRCEVCNHDGHKTHPDQDKIDAAKEIDRRSSQSTYHHALMFDGTNLVDTWDSNLQNPRKYRFRR